MSLRLNPAEKEAPAYMDLNCGGPPNGINYIGFSPSYILKDDHFVLDKSVKQLFSRNVSLEQAKNTCQLVIELSDKILLNPVYPRSGWGTTSEGVELKYALPVLEIYARFKYLLARFNENLPVADVLKPFLLEKKGYSELKNPSLYAEAYTKIADNFFTEEVLALISRAWNYKQNNSDINSWLGARLKFASADAQFRFIKLLALPYVGLDSFGFLTWKQFSIVNAQTTDRFLSDDKDSLLDKMTSRPHMLLSYLRHLESILVEKDKKTFLTNLFVKYPHFYRRLKENAGYAYRDYVRMTLVCNEESASYFMGVKDNWNQLKSDNLLSGFILTASKSVLSPLLLRYPQIMPILYDHYQFEGFINMARELPAILEPARMALVGEDNIKALIVSGLFKDIPISQTLVAAYEKHRDIINMMMYEAAATNDIARLEGLMKMTTTVNISKTKSTTDASVTAKAEINNGLGLFEKAKTIHQKEETQYQYQETVNFNKVDFIQYLKMKYDVSNEAERSALFFIRETEECVLSLVKLGVFAEKDKSQIIKGIKRIAKVELTDSQVYADSSMDNENLRQRVEVLETENEQLKKRLSYLETMFAQFIYNHASVTENSGLKTPSPY